MFQDEKRSFKRPNILGKKVPSVASRDPALKKDVAVKKSTNDTNTEMNNTMEPKIILVPSLVSLPSDETEDANLLPSKIKDKKSGIALLPVKRKSCGHYEPCESIVCDVTVQQCIEQDRVSPILAVNIEENEINAPVTKHCEDKFCDALNIDHDRCRRAIIRLFRCDISRMCDICERVLGGISSRLQHRKCARRIVYKHNDVDSEHLWRDKMRERELQILEATRARKNDYSDPVRGDDLAMEALRNNRELIIIPKTTPPPPSSSSPLPLPLGKELPTAIVTSEPSARTTVVNASCANRPANVPNSQAVSLKNILSHYVVAPHYTTPANVIRLVQTPQPTKGVRFTVAPQNPSTLAPAAPPSVIIPAQPRYVKLATTPSPSVVQPIVTVNGNWSVVSSSPVLTTAPIQSNSTTNVVPVRLVPITNLKTAPSLLHRTQGIPKFCIVADNSNVINGVITPVTVNPPPLQPMSTTTVVANINAAQERAAAEPKAPIKPPSPEPRGLQVRRKLSRKFSKKLKKKFFCSYCSKYFSTYWYFRMHVAKHNGEKLYTCYFCKESFSDWYDMKKHQTKEHKTEKKRDFVCKALTVSFKNIRQMPNTSDKNMDIKLKRHEEDGKDINHKHNSVCHKDRHTINETNHCCTTSTYDSNKMDTEKLKCENTLDKKKYEEIPIQIKEKLIENDLESVESSRVKEEFDSEELSAINMDDNLDANGFTFISVEKNIDPENFLQEAVVSR